MNFVKPVVACVTLLLIGCGQKGPLYLPAQSAEQINTPSTSEQVDDVNTQPSSAINSARSTESVEGENLANNQSVVHDD